MTGRGCREGVNEFLKVPYTLLLAFSRKPSVHHAAVQLQDDSYGQRGRAVLAGVREAPLCVSYRMTIFCISYMILKKKEQSVNCVQQIVPVVMASTDLVVIQIGLQDCQKATCISTERLERKLASEKEGPSRQGSWSFNQ